MCCGLNRMQNFKWKVKMCCTINVDTKFHVHQHVKTAKHTANTKRIRNGEKSQRLLKKWFNSDLLSNDKTQFNENLCKAIVSSNIPLKKLNNVNLRSFLEKYCKFNIPDESTLRISSVDSIYKSTMIQIRKSYVIITFMLLWTKLQTPVEDILFIC
uniref:Uncharacterized protein LOC114332020 n=1 Tax=Diabrotica virgifera virgifera TaxID=50390 RepID=A0A6P7FY92_DIAVI